MVCPVVDELARAVSSGLEAAYGARGSLRRQLRHARRDLPAHLRREGHLLAEAWDRATHPKLSRHIDRGRLRLAHDRLIAHLVQVDAAARRRACRIALAQGIAVNLLAAMAVLAGVAAWRGTV